MIELKNPTDKAIRGVDPSGIYAVYIQPGATRKVPESVVSSACAQGCVPVDTEVDNPATEENEPKVVSLVETINQVLDKGDESLLTSSGCPKASVLTDIAGKHTAADREAAYEQVKAERVEQDA